VRFRRLTIDQFGVWQSLELGPFDDGLNVLYGANETGKSTLLEFIRGLMFGFDAAKCQRFAPIDTNASWGGSAILSTAAGDIQFARRGSDGRGNLEPELRNLEGLPLPTDHLSRSFGSVDETIFERVFAIGLRELQELATLDDTEAAAALYRLTTGVDRISLAEVVQELAVSRERLLPSDDRVGRVGDLLAQRDQLRAELQSLGQSTEAYAAALAERRRLDRELSAADAEQSSLSADKQLVETALRMSSVWQDRLRTQQELTALGPQQSIPDELLRSLETARRRLEICRRNLRKLRVRKRRLSKAARRLPAKGILTRELAELEALCDQLPWVAQIEDQVMTLERALAADESRLVAAAPAHELSAAAAAGSRGAIGPGLRIAAVAHAVAGSIGPANSQATEAHVPRMVEAEAVRRLRQAAKQRRAARVAWKAARRELDALGPETVSAKQSGTALGLASGVPSQEELTPALEQTGQLVAQLRRRVQLDERLHQLADRRHVLDEQHRHFLDRQVLPTWVLSGLGVLFAFGIALFVSGFILPEAVTGPFSEMLIFLGLIGSVAAVGLKITIERRNKRGLETCRQQMVTLESQQQTAEQERDELDHQLPAGGGPLHARLQAAQKQLAELEGHLPTIARRQSSQAARQRASEAVESARSKLREAHRRWNAELRGAGLPTAISPTHAWRLINERQRHGVLSAEFAIRREEIANRRRAIDALGLRVNTAAGRLNTPVVGNTLCEQLERLRDFATGERRKADERQQLIDRVRQTSRRTRPWLRRLRQCKARRRRLLRQADAPSEAALRSRYALGLQARSLSDKLAQLETQFASAVAPPLQERLAELLTLHDSAALATQQVELEGRWQALEQSRRLRFERRGALAAEIASLAAQSRNAQASFELGVVECKLRGALERWQVLAVVEQLVDTVGRAYERDHQPATLREASIYLDRLTQGRYARVWTPWGEQRLRLEERGGRAVAIEQLSDGAREQLFLALRLALVAEFARRGVTLPVVLDDVLVNFDSERAGAAASLLKDFSAAGHQVLVFTCHEHLAAMFHDQGTAVHDLGQRRAWRAPRRAVVESLPSVDEVAPVAELRIDTAEPPPARRRTRRARPFAVAEEATPVIEGTAPVETPAATTTIRYLPFSGNDAEEFAGEFAERHARAARAAAEIAASAKRTKATSHSSDNGATTEPDESLAVDAPSTSEE
jgi:uncharacterized protein YhaN